MTYFKAAPSPLATPLLQKISALAFFIGMAATAHGSIIDNYSAASTLSSETAVRASCGSYGFSTATAEDLQENLASDIDLARREVAIAKRAGAVEVAVQ